MTYRVLTYLEYEAFADAEEKLYGTDSGCYAWTSVRDRSDSQALASMWDDAMAGVEMIIDFELTHTADQVAEVARRVAVAQYYLMFGELPDTPHECEHKWRSYEKIGIVCRDCGTEAPAEVIASWNG